MSSWCKHMLIILIFPSVIFLGFVFLAEFFFLYFSWLQKVLKKLFASKKSDRGQPQYMKLLMIIRNLECWLSKKNNKDKQIQLNC